MNLTYQQRCFIWASGHYLSEELDPDFYELNTQDQFEALEQMAWEPFEDYRGKDIYQYIYLNLLGILKIKNFLWRTTNGLFFTQPSIRTR